MASFNSTEFLTSDAFTTTVTTSVKDLTFGWIPNINAQFVLSKTPQPQLLLPAFWLPFRFHVWLLGSQSSGTHKGVPCR